MVVPVGRKAVRTVCLSNKLRLHRTFGSTLSNHRKHGKGIFPFCPQWYGEKYNKGKDFSFFIEYATEDSTHIIYIYGGAGGSGLQQ